MRTPLIFIIAFVFATTQFAFAATVPQVPAFINCQNLFGNGYLTSSGTPLVSTALSSLVVEGPNTAPTTLGFIGVAVMIIIAVVTVLGLVFAFGMAFHIQSLMQFAKSELFESFMNVVILAMVVGGTPAFYGAISFLANVGSFNIQNSGVVPVQNAAYHIYDNTCNNLLGGIVTAGFENWLGVFVSLFYVEISSSYSQLLMPNGLGVSANPFAGISLTRQLLWDEQSIFFGTMTFGIFLIMLMFVIYYLFPLFFFVGLILRSFPWTRAAGGSLIAMFLAFWLVFPALVYSFSLVGYQGATASITCGTESGLTLSSCSIPSFTSFFSLTQIKDALPTNVHDIGTSLYNDVGQFASAAAYTGVQMIGLIISLFISYEIVEKVGGLLGSPSLQPHRALGRVL